MTNSLRINRHEDEVVLCFDELIKNPTNGESLFILSRAYLSPSAARLLAEKLTELADEVESGSAT